jgi:type III secretory pathway component EscV
MLHHYSDAESLEFPERAAETTESAQALVPIVTPIGLEVGRDLIPIFEPSGAGANRALDELAPGLRDALRTELGFPFPGIRVLGNDTDMPPCGALILIDEVPELMFEVGRDDVLVDATAEELAALGTNSRSHVHPATGRTMARIAAEDRTAAQSAGFATWDADRFAKQSRVLRRQDHLPFVKPVPHPLAS